MNAEEIKNRVAAIRDSYLASMPKHITSTEKAEAFRLANALTDLATTVLVDLHRIADAAEKLTLR